MPPNIIYKQKRRAAEALYKAGWSKTDIAYVMELSITTVYAWGIGGHHPLEELDKTYYTLTEVASITGLALSAIKELKKKQQIPFIIRSGHPLVSVDEVESLKKRRRKTGIWSQQQKSLEKQERIPIRLEM
jgi:hypothetical protein